MSDYGKSCACAFKGIGTSAQSSCIKKTNTRRPQPGEVRNKEKEKG